METLAGRGDASGGSDQGTSTRDGASTAATATTTAATAPALEPGANHHTAAHVPAVPVPAGRLHTLTVGPAAHSDVVLHTCPRGGTAAAEEEGTRPGGAGEQRPRRRPRPQRKPDGQEAPQPEKPPPPPPRCERASQARRQRQSVKRSGKLGRWEQLKAVTLAKLEWLCLQLYPKRARGGGGDGSDATRPLPAHADEGEQADEGVAGPAQQEEEDDAGAAAVASGQFSVTPANAEASAVSGGDPECAGYELGPLQPPA